MPEQLAVDTDRLPPDQAARERITDGPRHDPVRRGRCGVRKDLGPGRAGPGAGDGRPRRAPPHRRHHLHREGGGRAARPHPGRAREGGRGRPRRRRWGSAAARPWTSSTGRPSAPSTRSPNACSPSTRSRPGFRPGSRCSTRSARRWPSTPAGRSFRDELLADPALERTLLLLFASGVKPTALRSLAEAFDDNWDLVHERVPATCARPTVGPPAVRRRARQRSDDVCAEPCRDPTTSCACGSTRSPAHGRAGGASTDELDLLEALGQQANPKLPSFKVGRTREEGLLGLRPGRLRPGVPEAGEGSGGGACRGRQRVRPSDSAAPSERSPWPARGRASGPGSWSSTICSSWPGPCCVIPSTARRCGRPCTSATTVCSSTSSRTPIPFRSSWPFASPPPTRDSEAAGSEPWDEVDVAPGHLFVVGDPKQSIYRFRRADIATFLRAAERFGAEGGGVVELTANFRTVEPIIELGQPHLRRAHGRSPTTSPCRLPLAARLSRPRRPPAPLAGIGPAVAVLGTPRASQGHHGRRPTRRPKPSEVAPTVDPRHRRRMGRQRQGTVAGARPGWATSPCWCRPGPRCRSWRTPSTRPASPFGPRPARWSTPAGPCATCSWCCGPSTTRPTTSTSSPRCAHRCWPAATTTSSGSSGSGGGAGAISPTSPTRCPLDDPVRAGLAYLRSLYDQRTWLAPSELLGRITRDRRALELGFAEGRPRDVWRRLRFVIDQARAWSEATGGNLRQYLHWVAVQTAEGARVAESILPENDDDAVRILTIHGAKGLEFPITIVSGMSTAPSARAAPAEVVFPDATGRSRLQVRQQGHAPRSTWTGRRSTSRWDSTNASACSTWRAPGPATTWSCRCIARSGPMTPEPEARTNAELLLDGMGDLVKDLPDAAIGAATRSGRSWSLRRRLRHRFASGRPNERQRSAAGVSPDDRGRHCTDRRGRARQRGGTRPRPAEATRDLDLPPWLKGRYGTAVGRAVHGVLQTIDLATGAGLDEALAAQCEAEAVPDRLDDVRLLVRAGARVSVGGGGRRSPHWREIYVVHADRGATARGLHRPALPGPEGLVVVDYKTAATSDPDELDRRVEGYRTTGGLVRPDRRRLHR